MTERHFLSNFFFIFSFQSNHHHSSPSQQPTSSHFLTPSSTFLQCHILEKLFSKFFLMLIITFDYTLWLFFSLSRPPPHHSRIIILSGIKESRRMRERVMKVNERKRKERVNVQKKKWSSNINCNKKKESGSKRALKLMAW